MRLSDESVMEGGHLTPEERIALQAEEIKRLWQENEQLRAQLESLRCSSCGELPELIATDDGDYCEKCADFAGGLMI